jgi:hypothetical protein
MVAWAIAGHRVRVPDGYGIRRCTIFGEEPAAGAYLATLGGDHGQYL